MNSGCVKKKGTREAISRTERTEHKFAALNAAVNFYYVMYHVYIHRSKGVSSGGIKFYDYQIMHADNNCMHIFFLNSISIPLQIKQPFSVAKRSANI